MFNIVFLCKVVHPQLQEKQEQSFMLQITNIHSAGVIRQPTDPNLQKYQYGTDTDNYSLYSIDNVSIAASVFDGIFLCNVLHSWFD